MVSVNICLFPCWSFTATSARNKHFKEILYSIWHIGLFIADKSISPALAQIMEGRQIYQHQPGQPALPVSDYTERYVISTAAPILSEGDVLGCVVFLCEQDHLAVGETEYPLAQTIAGFLGRHMEA